MLELALMVLILPIKDPLTSMISKWILLGANKIKVM
jgi:hypothetical protein